MHRKMKRPHAREENFFRFLFLVLLFLSVLRVIDLLPSSYVNLRPVFAVSTPGPSVEPKETAGTRDLEFKPPTSLCIGDIDLAARSKALDLRGPAPKILIYHTHTTEAYTATTASPYVQTSSYRTADTSKSVVAVGEALARRLRTEYGFAVLHDTTDHEPPSLKTAYSRSEITMLRYLEQYPSLVLFIDIHRDAGSDTSDYVLVDGVPTARLMCVVGQGTEYEDKPDFDRNFALASALTTNLRRVEKRLSRDVRVKTGRYNQHVGPLSLLIEVGHNANTLEQALHAVPSLAECLALTLAETEAPETEAGNGSDQRRLWIPRGAGIDKE